MRGLLYLVAGALVVMGVGYLLFGKYPPYWSSTFEVSLDIEEDGKLVTGSAVYRVSSSKFGPLVFGEGPHVSEDWQGNALTVDLGARGLLFMTRFDSDCRKSSKRLGQIVWDVTQNTQNPWEADVPLTSLPLLMRFRNIDDRDTLQEVNPTDLSAEIGPGVKLLRARFRSTDASVSPIPATWPKWLVDAPVTPYGQFEDGACHVNFNPLWFRF